LDENDEIISTYTIADKESKHTEEEEETEEDIANQTDSEEEQEEEEEETNEKTEKTESTTDTQETQENEELNNETGEGQIYNAKKLLNATYEATKFIDYLILENAHKDEHGQSLLSDIGGINPTKYYTKNEQRLTPITKPFIDTLMLFKLIDGKTHI